MKKSAIVLMVTLLTAFTISLPAQNFSLGVKTGLNIPRLTAGGSENPLNSGYESRLGPSFGIYCEQSFSKLFSLSVGAEYSSQGGQKDKFQAFVPAGDLAPVALAMGIDYLYADFKSVAKLNYMLFPVLARFNWDLFSELPLKLYAALGPFAGFLLNAKQVTSGSSIIYADQGRTMPLTQAVSFDNTTDIKEEIHTFNAGFYGLVGFSYCLTSKSSLFIEGGGNYGFTPIQKEQDNGKNYAGAGSVNIGFAVKL